MESPLIDWTTKSADSVALPWAQSDSPLETFRKLVSGVRKQMGKMLVLIRENGYFRD